MSSVTERGKKDPPPESLGIVLDGDTGQEEPIETDAFTGRTLLARLQGWRKLFLETADHFGRERESESE